jgi:hypothetical protein
MESKINPASTAPEASPQGHAPTRSAAQQAYIDATLARMKAEISLDVATGRQPQHVASFGDLDDHVDANEYGGMCEDSDSTGPKGLDLLRALFPDPEGAPDYGTMNSQAGMDVANDLQNAADAWIKTGALRALPIHFEGFEQDGMQITNPTSSDCSRFHADPRTAYGFEHYDTGGGFTALYKETDDNGEYILLTDKHGESHELGKPGDTFLLGTYDAEATPLGLWEMQVAVTFSNEDDADAPRNQILIQELKDQIRQATRQQAQAYKESTK